MEIEYVTTLWVEEQDIQKMKKKVRRGEDPDWVFDDWRAGLDDEDFYATHYPDVRKRIMEEITKKA